MRADRASGDHKGRRGLTPEGRLDAVHQDRDGKLKWQMWGGMINTSAGAAGPGPGVIARFG